MIPQAYRSIDIKSNSGTPVENNDKGGGFTQSLIFARDNSSSSSIANKRTANNVNISVYELGLNEDPTVWHVNSNNGRFYTGAYNVNVEAPYGGHSNFMFYSKGTNNGKTEVSPIDNGIDIALGSKKITEMVKLELKEYPETLNLSLKTGNKSAIRAAFYSAAFLLQRALADKLDVQPDEIEICEKIDNQHDYPSIYLSDALPNGAGIVSYLYEDGKLEDLINSIINFDSFDANKTPKENSFMQSIISDDHRHNCLTACQKCLLTYSNRGYHHIIDWRLGVGLLRLMMDEKYDFGFNKEKRKNYEEFSDWHEILSACSAKLNLESTSYGQSCWMINNECTIIYHPLWNKGKVLETLDKHYTSLRMYNTFKLLRSDLTEDKDDVVASHSQPGVSYLNKIRRGNVIPTTSQENEHASDDDIEL